MSCVSFVLREMSLWETVGEGSLGRLPEKDVGVTLLPVVVSGTACSVVMYSRRVCRPREYTVQVRVQRIRVELRRVRKGSDSRWGFVLWR